MERIIRRTLALILVLSMLICMTALAEEKQDLNLSLFSGGYAGYWEELVAAFQQDYPQYNVIADIDSKNHERVRVSLLAGDPPDFVFTNLGDYNLFDAAQSGMFTDLNEIFFDLPVEGLEGMTYRDIFAPTDISAVTIDGKTSLVPSDVGYEGWWYNAALFREKGWTVPKTWDEFNELAEKIKAEGIAPLAYQGLYPTYLIWGYVLEALAAQGGRQTYVDCIYLGAEDPWHSEAALNAIRHLTDMVEKGYILEGTTALNHTESQMEFLQGHVAFIPCGTWFENEMKDSIPEGFEMTFCPVPEQDADGNNYVCKYMSYYGIPEDAKNKEGAVEFLKYIYSEKGQCMVASHGFIPAPTYIYDSVFDYYTPVLKAAIETSTSDGVAFVENNGEILYGAIYDAIDDCITNAVLGEITAEEFCDTVQEKYDEMVADDEVLKVPMN